MSIAALAPPVIAFPTVPLMGLDVAAVSERETIEYILDASARGRGGWICSMNLHNLRQWRRSAELQELVADADLVVADGMPLVWAGRLQGFLFPERVAGSSLINTLTAAAADSGASVFLLGGNPGTAEKTAKELVKRNPHGRLVGTLCPPVGFERDPDSLDRIAQTLTDAAPNIVFVGLGCPKQERLILELRPRLPSTWFVPCGVAFSMVAGEFPRAPRVVQKLGLEWLHRMLQEPKRLYRRYLFQGIPFLVQLLSVALTFRFRHAAGFRGVH
jgi:N-acetylglucosaminyldiphosphoundecaprenol N-acetyl-beta-D-mannosaminyltransferase